MAEENQNVSQPPLPQLDKPQSNSTMKRREFLERAAKTVAALSAKILFDKTHHALGKETTLSYPPGEKIGNAEFETYGANEGLSYDQMQSLFADLNKSYENGENPKEGTKLYQTIFIRESSYKATNNWNQAGYENFESFAQAHNDELSSMLQAKDLDGCKLRRVIVVKDDADIPGTWQTNEQWYKTGIKDSDGTAGDWIYPNAQIYKPIESAYFNSEKKLDYGWIHETGHFLLNLPDYYGLDVYFQNYVGKPSLALSTNALIMISTLGEGSLKARLPNASEKELTALLIKVKTELQSREVMNKAILEQGKATVQAFNAAESEEDKATALSSADTTSLYIYATMSPDMLRGQFPELGDSEIQTFKQKAAETVIAKATETTQTSEYDFHTDPFAGMPVYWREFRSLDPNHISPQLFPENMILPGKPAYSEQFSGMHLKKRKANNEMRYKSKITHETFRALPVEHLPPSIGFSFKDPENENRWKSTATEDVEVTVLQTNGEWMAQGIEVNEKFDAVKISDAKLNVGTLFRDRTRTKTLAGDPNAKREMVDMSDATYLIRVVKKNKSTGEIIDEGWRWLNWRDAAAGQEPGETAAENLHTEMEFFLHDATQLANWGSSDMFRADWTITYNKTVATNTVNLPLVVNN